MSLPPPNLLLTALQTIGEISETYLFAKDTMGRYLYANPQALGLFQCSLEHLLGKTDEFFLTAESVSHVREVERRVLEDGETVSLAESLEFLRDQRTLSFQTRRAPIRDERGNIIGVCGLSTGVTEHLNLKKSLVERGQLLETVLNGVDTHIYIKDRDGRFIFASPQVAKTFKLPLDRIIGHTGYDFLQRVDADHFRELDDRVFSSETQQIAEEHFTDAEGKTHYFRSAKIPLKLAGQNDVLIGFSTDITETKELKDLLQKEMMTDKLTGLPNRLSFVQQTSQALRLAADKDSGLAVIVIGLDRFKDINDTIGHGAGDAILIEAATRLKSITDEKGAVFRLGGDQFAVCLLADNSYTAVASLAQYILDSLASPYASAQRQLFLTASIGVSNSPKDGTSVEDLLKKGETAMFHAKSRGRNTCHFFSSFMETAVMERMEMERDLRLALSQAEFELQFQPIVAAGSGKTVALEALIRWERPGHGLVLPNMFITVAEEIGIIEQLGEWVIAEACQQLSHWHKTVDPSLRVSINLSSKQLQNPNLASRFLPILQRNGILPHMIELEITESVVMTEPELQIGHLQSLRACGFSFAIDDFGTGYSSLSYIQKLPVSVLKIDRAFVQSIEADYHQSALCRGIIALAHSLDLKTVAEGVETDMQAQLLSCWGCDYLQGYYYSKPLTIDQVPVILGSNPAAPEGPVSNCNGD